MALALSTALAVMLATRTVHPAGSNPLIVFLLGSNWDYLLFPSLMGSVNTIYKFSHIWIFNLSHIGIF
jgi:CBS-domain-containing membrane protein